ncbi:MAG TPA: prolyl oligopeptidase family serine peptidase, partial [Acidobacteriota bacterium]|nr:prolyl oligopeptidase family serine peptidase [Acidobacteriota bacterium]
QVWNYERYGIPYQEHGHYFYSKNNGLQNQSVLYHVNNLTDEPKVLLDPNTLSSDGTVALQDYAISRDAKYMAYALSSAGSDWAEWKVRDVQSAKDLSDHIKWTKFSGAEWTVDGKGFFYSRYDEPKSGQELAGLNYNQKLCYHILGTPQSEDKIIYQRPDHKEWGFYPKVSEDGQYLIVTVSRDTAPKYLIFYQALKQKDSKMVELINEFEAEYLFLGNDGPLFWFKTNLNAPKGRVVAIDIRTPQQENWKEVVPESPDTIQSIGLINNQFIISYLKDAHSVVKEFDLNGKFLRDISIPGIGTVSGFGGKRRDTETFYAFTSYTTPTIIYRYDVKEKQIEIFREPKIDFRPTDFETTQIFYQSKDGTKVPMFITHKKGLKPDKNTPAFLYAYGGFNIPETPNFSAMMLVWMEMGGIYSVPNIRGGGEYGEEWHKAGTKLHKQNVFDDFIAAAEWLIANGYTSKPKLAINGASNGGLLVGACLTQRPDLYGAAVPEVGVMDMLRFHKFTIGWAWVSDFGSSDNADDFKALYAYSPYHNIKKGTSYPPTFITTADHDDRVVPGHSFKFAAALQAAQAGDEPILIRIETKAGHGAGKPISKIIEQAGDELTFLTAALNIPES